MAAFPAHRNSMISKIHIAKKDLAMEDADYRALLERVTGKTSSKDMAMSELQDVLNELTSLGFKAKPKAPLANRPLADDPQSKKIRGLWITLRDMGELTDPSEKALNAFVKKITGVEDLSWLNSQNADKAIKALRGWITRKGGDPDEY